MEISKNKHKSLEDVLKSTELYKKNTIQLATFLLNKNQATFGININKVKSFRMIKDINISISETDKSIIVGMCLVENEMYPVVCLERWLINDYKFKIEDYTILILTEFNGKFISFLAKELLGIKNKLYSELEESNILKDKITYVTKIDVENFDYSRKIEKYQKYLKKLENRRNKKYLYKDIERLNIKRAKEQKKLSELHSLNIESKRNSQTICLVLDIETLLYELLPEQIQKIENDISNMTATTFTKKVFVAEDSKVAISILKDIFIKTGVEYSFFTNGKELCDYIQILNENEKNNIGLIITDLEMPIMDGFGVLKFLNEIRFKGKIAVNTSMSNDGVLQKVKSLDADYFIQKTIPTKINEILKDSCQ